MRGDLLEKSIRLRSQRLGLSRKLLHSNAAEGVQRVTWHTGDGFKSLEQDWGEVVGRGGQLLGRVQGARNVRDLGIGG